MLQIITLTLAISTAIALIIEWTYDNLKDTAETEAEERLERALDKLTRPIVKVEIKSKGEW